MDKITKEYFTEWALENNWLKIGEGKDNKGFAQENFVTPSGQIVFVTYDSEGSLRNVSISVPIMAAPPTPMPTQFLPPNLGTGGKPWPPIR